MADIRIPDHRLPRELAEWKLANPKIRGRKPLSAKRRKRQRAERSCVPLRTDGRKEREANLAAMGFRCYRAYLASPLWRSIRVRVWKEKGNDCCVCGCESDEIHHDNYRTETLKGEGLAGLWPVCIDCHGGLESRDSRARHKCGQG